MGDFFSWLLSCANLLWRAKVCIRVNAAPKRRSKIVRASTASAWAWSNSTGCCAAVWICLDGYVSIGFKLQSIHVLRDDSTKPRSLHDNIPLCPSTHIGHFHTNVLTLSITICPYHQQVGASSLCQQILLDWFWVFGYYSQHRRVEQCKWIAWVPWAMIRTEIIWCEMTRDGCNSECRVCLWVIEIVILDILVLSLSLN